MIIRYDNVDVLICFHATKKGNMIYILLLMMFDYQRINDLEMVFKFQEETH